tara:strand:- start:194 stop:415 length:222 start_codon:yes stop_codon:yes gene_type:complete
MKLAFTLSLVLISLFTFSDKSFSLTDYQIKKICKKEKKGLKERELNCIKNLIEKRSNLQKGNLIEIPVIPFKN